MDHGTNGVDKVGDLGSKFVRFRVTEVSAKSRIAVAGCV